MGTKASMIDATPRGMRRLWPLLVILLVIPTLGISGCESGESEAGDEAPPALLGDELRSAEYWVEVYELAPVDPLVEQAQKIFARLRPVFGHAGNRLYVIGPDKLADASGFPFAAALPDGNVVLNRAGLELCYRGVSQDEGDSRLALVLAHELSHFQADHHWNLDAPAMALALEGEEEVVSALREDLGTNLQEARKLELHADEGGVIGMTIAGFDPLVVVGDESFFAEWVGTATGQVAYQDESHPTPETRLVNARGRLERAMAKVSVFHEGARALEAGSYPAAIAAFEEVRRSFESREVLSNLGLAYYQLAALALADCDGLLVTTWRMPVAIDHETLLDRTRNRGGERSHCYEGVDYLDAFDRAKEVLGEAHRQDEDYHPALLNLAALHMLDDSPAWARSYATTGAELFPDDSRFRNALLTVDIADLLARDKSFTEEAAALEGLHREHPDDPDIAFNAAKALTLAGHYDRAEPIWRAFLRLEPDTAWAEIARWNLGEEPESPSDVDRVTK